MWDFMKFLALMKINNDGIGNNDEENRKILTEKIIPGLKILESWEADSTGSVLQFLLWKPSH